MSARQYELVYIVSPAATDETVADLHAQVEAIVSRFGGRIDQDGQLGPPEARLRDQPLQGGHLRARAVDGHRRDGDRVGAAPARQRRRAAPPRRPGRRGAGIGQTQVGPADRRSARGGVRPEDCLRRLSRPPRPRLRPPTRRLTRKARKRSWLKDEADAADAAGAATRVVDERERAGRTARAVPPAQGVPLLRRQDRLHRLQGRAAADAVDSGAGQDSASPDFGYVHHASAQAPDRHQAGAAVGGWCRT